MGIIVHLIEEKTEGLRLINVFIIVNKSALGKPFKISEDSRGVSLRKGSELDSPDNVFQNCVSIVSNTKNIKAAPIQVFRIRVNSDLLDFVFS